MGKFCYTEHAIYKVKLHVGKGYNTMYFSSNNEDEINEFLDKHYEGTGKTYSIKEICSRKCRFVVTKDLVESRKEKLKKLIKK
jgi:hypothetical protein